jgi:hypothetical protein
MVVEINVCVLSTTKYVLTVAPQRVRVPASRMIP